MRTVATPLLTACAALGAAASAAQAAPVETVTTLADGGAGSLRQAIAQVDAGGTVAFAPSLRGTIVLTSGQLSIDKGLTIAGPGAQALTVSGGDRSRVLAIDSSGDVTLSGLTFADGRVPAAPVEDGGAVRKAGSGTLTIRDSRVLDSTVEPTTFEPVGGGVAQLQGDLLMERVTLAGNTIAGVDGWAYGGGLGMGSDAGSATLRDVTITGNTADGYGGGVVAAQSGSDQRIVLEHVTIAGNSAGNGGSGLIALPQVELVDSIVAGPPAAGGIGACLTLDGPVLARGTNLIEDVSWCALAGSGKTIAGVDPLLGPLALNGPGQTETIAPRAGSPALDAAPRAGDGGCSPAADQRGVPRPQGAACDLGAFEARPAAARLTPAAHDFGARRVGDGAGARATVTLANADDADLPLATAPLALAGAGADQFALDGAGCPAALAPGAACALAVAFAPTRAGAAAATLRAGGAEAALTGIGELLAPPPDPPVPPAPPAPRVPAPVPRSPARAAAITRFTLAARCVRPSRAGQVRIGLRVRLTRPTSVRVELARAVGTGVLRRCPRGGGSFGGRFEPAGSFTRDGAAASAAAAPAPAATAAATAITRRYTLTARLAPALYRVTVRPRSGGRLGRPLHRYLRVLAR